MSSTRTIKFGDAELKWYTGSIRALYYSHEIIRAVYKDLVKPCLVCGEGINTRSQVFNLVHDHIKSGRVTTMFDFCNLIMAIRCTEIDECHPDDDGKYPIRFVNCPLPEREMYTYYNITWHMNHHCKQLYRCCFIQVIRRYDGASVALAYTDGEGYDRKNFFLDEMLESKRPENIEARRKYIKKEIERYEST